MAEAPETFLEAVNMKTKAKTMRKDQNEEIEIVTPWGTYKHTRPSNRGMIIVISIAVLIAAVTIVRIYVHA